jgi:hypothetical protein
MFDDPQVAHQVVDQVHEADLHLGTGQSDGADELAAHAVLLKSKDVLDAGADLGALAIVDMLLGAECLALLADVDRIAGVLEHRLGLQRCGRRYRPTPGDPGCRSRSARKELGCHARSPA